MYGKLKNDIMSGDFYINWNRLCPTYKVTLVLVVVECVSLHLAKTKKPDKKLFQNNAVVL